MIILVISLIILIFYDMVVLLCEINVCKCDSFDSLGDGGFFKPMVIVVGK